jgi:hypothetical protein
LPVGGVDDISDLFDGFAAVEGILVGEAVLDPVGELYSSAESTCDAGEDGWIDDGGASWGWTGSGQWTGGVEDGTSGGGRRGHGHGAILDAAFAERRGGFHGKGARGL